MSKNIFKNFSLLIILALTLLILALPLVSIEAANNAINNPLSANTFTELFIGIADWVAGIVASVAALMIVVGGFQYMLSGGNEEKVATARKTIYWSLIGLIVILGSWGLLRALLEILGITVT
ncbi:MAG: hypothetical protein ISS88_03215 [Candidatus Portnoybacteria bacterium]|nr:hypothetical protein [Candidatus Portnoybacteria bacterium]